MQTRGCVQCFKKPGVRTAERNSVTDMEDPLTLSTCRELRELQICALYLGTMELNLVSSITSTNIQRITFTQPIGFEEPTVPDYCDWAVLDNSLCWLVDRLESGLWLEVEFQAFNLPTWWNGELDCEKWLPRFYERGGVSGG